MVNAKCVGTHISRERLVTQIGWPSKRASNDASEDPFPDPAAECPGIQEKHYLQAERCLGRPVSRPAEHLERLERYEEAHYQCDAEAVAELERAACGCDRRPRLVVAPEAETS